ncbi:MAG TPA: hypothetical protein VMV45_12515 [Casimicrobiaceae bacterium]|nr:hypothetical protein [Casimicrobiaceae bacterium]
MSRPAKALRSPMQAKRWLWLVGHLFPPGQSTDAVTTTATFRVQPEHMWDNIVFYEDVEHPPPLLLRMFLPTPVRTDGGAKDVGTMVECTYAHGKLVKRITEIDPPRLLRFDVVGQHLGIERCITTLGGSYAIQPSGDHCEVALTTRYRAHLRPRWLWRSFERLLAHQLHRHILAGMTATARQSRRAEPASR